MNTGEEMEKKRKWEEESERREHERKKKGCVTLQDDSERRGDRGEKVCGRGKEGNSSGEGRKGRKDVVREKKILSPPIHRRIASDARKA